MNIKSINKITIINVLSTVLLQGISVLTMPLFTRLLGAEQYGIYSVFASWVSIVTCFIGLSVASSLGTGIYTFKNEYFAFRSSVLLLGTVICALFCGVIFIFIKPVSMLLKFSYVLIIVLMVSAIAHFVVNFVQLACTYEKEADKNFVISVTISLTTSGASLALIYFLPEHIKFWGRVMGVTIPYVIAAIVLWIWVFFKKPTGIKSKYCKYALAMGIPIVFHSLSQNILSNSDRVMMQNMGVSNADIGIYSTYNTFAAVVGTLLSAFNNSWCPFLYDDLDSKNWIALRKKYVNYIELFSVIVIGFLLLSREVSYIMASREYWIGIDAIPIFTVSIFFIFMYQFPVNFEFFHKKTKIVAVGTIFAGIINIVFNAIMIPLWGFYGAAIATAISYFGLFCAHYFVVKKIKFSEYPLKAYPLFGALGVIFVFGILFYVLAEFWYLRWILGAFIGLWELRRIVKRKSIF